MILLTAHIGFFAPSSRAADRGHYHERKPIPAIEQVDWDSCMKPEIDKVPEISKHGVKTFKSRNFMMFNQNPDKAYKIPKGFEPIGYNHKKDDCVSFSPSQQGVFVSTSSFTIRKVEIPHLSHDNVFFVWPSYVQEADQQGYIDMVKYSFEKVGSLFPRAEVKQDKYWFFVTAFMMGNGSNKNKRAFAFEGPSMTTIEHNWENIRMKELSLHRTAHYFNRYNSVATNPSTSPLFPRTSFEEAVASWVETVFMPDKMARHSRVFSVLYPTYREKVLKSGTELRFRMRLNRTKSLLAVDHEYERFVHYMYGPVLMLGLESLLQKSGSEYNLTDLLTEFHKADESDFMAVIRRELTEEHNKTFDGWLYGKLIPKDDLLNALSLYDEL